MFSKSRRLGAAAAVVAVCLGVGPVRAEEDAVKEAQRRLQEAQRQLQQAVEARAREGMRRPRTSAETGSQGASSQASGGASAQASGSSSGFAVGGASGGLSGSASGSSSGSESGTSSSQASGGIVVIGPDGKTIFREFNPMTGTFSPMAAEWSEFIIGVALRNVPEGFHGLIGVEDGVGVLISDVLPDSPAAQAGIQQHDLILGVNGEAVRSPEQLQKIISGIGEKELTLQLRRKSDAVEVKVTPKKNDQPRPDPSGSTLFWDRPVPMQWSTGGVRSFAPGMLIAPPGHGEDSYTKELKSLREQLDKQAKQLQELTEAMKELKSTK